MRGQARARRRQGARGFTVVEVMVALALLTIGAAGVVAMQRTTLLGNVRARNLATANAVATAWVERLRNDALHWTNGPTPTLLNTRWLNAVGNDFPTISGTEDVWFQPAPDGALDISPMADVRGRDTFVDDDAAFCTNVKLTQLLPTLIRAEIRVYWLRHGGGGTINGQPLCDPAAGYIDAVSAARDRYHTIYVTTAVIRTDF